MKRLIFAFGLLVGSSTLITAEAQQISVQVNIGNQPAWGPVGYDYVNYYYMPDIDVYYNVPASMFYFRDRGRWVSARYLPYSYRNYDLYRMYKVVLNDRDPWNHNRYHVNTYARYRGNHNQVIIYNSSDRRYRDSRRNAVAWYNDTDRRYDRYNDRQDTHRNTNNWREKDNGDRRNTERSSLQDRPASHVRPSNDRQRRADNVQVSDRGNRSKNEKRNDLSTQSGRVSASTGRTR
ncbi:MAG: hypothetical protein RL662_2476 [Bacteroidota bacterium]|jgi:hypothetical protein